MDLEVFTKEIKKKYKIKFLKFHVDSAFSSTVENHRQNIRQHISDHYHIDAKNLDELPYSKNFHFSISHSKDWGGYAVSNEKVGLDIENLPRLDPKVVKRVTVENERLLIPDIRWLWPMKESLVKLNSYKKNNSILISNFEIIQQNEENFIAINKKNRSFWGSIYIKDDTILAVSFLKRSAILQFLKNLLVF